MKGLRTFTCKPRPESGLDCLICAIFAGQRQKVEARAGKMWSFALVAKPRDTKWCPGSSTLGFLTIGSGRFAVEMREGLWSRHHGWGPGHHLENGEARNLLEKRRRITTFSVLEEVHNLKRRPPPPEEGSSQPSSCTAGYGPSISEAHNLLHRKFARARPHNLMMRPAIR